jgi:hypothetical protein
VWLYEDTEEREDEATPEWAEPDEVTEDEPLVPGAAD